MTDELKSISYVLDQCHVPNTAFGGEGDAEVEMSTQDRIRCLHRMMNEQKHRAEAVEARVRELEAKLAAVREAGQAVLDWYNRDGSVGGACDPMEQLQTAIGGNTVYVGTSPPPVVFADVRVAIGMLSANELHQMSLELSQDVLSQVAIVGQRPEEAIRIALCEALSRFAAAKL